MKDFVRHILTLLIPLLTGFSVAAEESPVQGYGVASFRQLPNDVTAFITPVRDLNGDDCAVIKVQGSPDFVFSTPLGIVKREDGVGEIWIYIPAGSRRLTIKHPEWGVIRDYIFPEKIVGHMAYELRVSPPASALSRLESLPPDTVYTTLRDTLVITRTDTLRVATPEVVRRPVPLHLHVMPVLGFGGKAATFTGGLRLVLMKRHGGYLHISSDFGRIGPMEGECDRLGYIDGSLPFYSGKRRHSCLIASAGAV